MSNQIKSTRKITSLKRTSAATLAALSLACAPAWAQFSGDVIKVGFLTDISGIYSDNDGNQGGD